MIDSRRTAADHPVPPRPAHVRARDLIPAAVAVVLAIVGPTVDDPAAGPCPAGTDGPQFLCWLRSHPEATG